MPFNIACVIFVCQGVWDIYFQVNANKLNPMLYIWPWPGAWAGAGAGLGWSWAGPIDC